MLLDQLKVPPEHHDLFGPRTDTPYTEAEREYSMAIHLRLEELLAGTRQRMVLLRRYHDGSARLTVMRASREIDRAGLRLDMAERLLMDPISFVRDISPGGPVFQAVRRDQLVETQHFATKYPHIVIERQDIFRIEDRSPLYTEWRLRRTQNQRAETQINRWLDAANLGLSLLKSLRGE